MQNIANSHTQQSNLAASFHKENIFHFHQQQKQIPALKCVQSDAQQALGSAEQYYKVLQINHPLTTPCSVGTFSSSEYATCNEHIHKTRNCCARHNTVCKGMHICMAMQAVC